MTNYVQVGNLQVAEVLFQFINEQVLPNSGVEQTAFWDGFDQLVHELAPENKALLAKRDSMQAQINDWHKGNKGNFQFADYKAFLEEIGYVELKVEEFQVETENVDAEIAYQAGPQLVVPVSNARYAINAANARWGSFYDALYGTDAISDEDGAEAGKGYNPIRGNKVIDY
ncbi:MAG: malate synthase G, partial [Solibacillus isronensis]